MADKCSIRPWEWEDDQVVAACLDYRTRSEIRDRNPSAYVCIAYRDLWDRLTWLRGRNAPRSPRVSNERIIGRSRDFTGEGRGAFQKAEPNLYAAAYRRHLLDEMPWLDDPRGRTTREILEGARKYASLAEFKRGDLSGYLALRKRDTLQLIDWFDVDETGTEEERAARRAFVESVRSGGLPEPASTGAGVAPPGTVG